MPSLRKVSEAVWRVGTGREALGQFSFLFLPILSYLAWLVVAAVFLLVRGTWPWIAPIVPWTLLGASLLSVLWIGAAILLWPPLRVEERWARKTHLRIGLFAWGTLTVSFVVFLLTLGLGLLSPLGEFVPSSFYPAIEVSVLVVTGLLLGLLTHYSVESYGADAKALVEGIDRYSTATSFAITGVGAQIAESFRTESRRLSEDFQLSAQDIRKAVDLLRDEMVAVRGLLQRQIGEIEALRKGQETVAEQNRREAESRRLAGERKDAEERRLREREARPIITAGVRGEGTLFHSIYVDVENKGPPARDCEVAFGVDGAGSATRLPLSSLARDEAKSYKVGGVRDFPDDCTFIVEAHYSDVHGCAYSSQVRFTYHRETGIFGRTKGFRIEPGHQVNLP